MHTPNGFDNPRPMLSDISVAALLLVATSTIFMEGGGLLHRRFQRKCGKSTYIFQLYKGCKNKDPGYIR